MTDGREKLKKDLDILQSMVDYRKVISLEIIDADDRQIIINFE